MLASHVSMERLLQRHLWALDALAVIACACLVNGLATGVPQNALAIYASLRSVDHLSVAVQRDGRAITAEYDIR